MPERFDAVDTEDRDVITITAEELSVLLDINFFQRVKVINARLFHLRFHVFTQTATGLGVKDNANFWFHGISRFRNQGFET